MCLCALFACAFLTKAQGLGDYMEIDGVPGFVFYVDETGEHGLEMSALGQTPKMAKKIAKYAQKLGKKNGMSKEQAALFLSPKLVIPAPTQKISSKEKKQHYSELVKILGEEGEQNTLLIAEYCKEKGISLQDYFPRINWATQLGEGWFIPGDKELTLFAEFYAGGLGKENKLGTIFFRNRGKELSNDPFVQTVMLQAVLLGISSSTMKDEKYGFRALFMNPGLKAFLKIDDRVNVKHGPIITKAPVDQAKSYLGIAAIHKF